MIPVSYREAWVNGHSRMAMEARVAKELTTTIPPQATVLMYGGDHVGILQKAGIGFDRVTSEFSPLEWQAALSMPAMVADYVVAVDDDPVAEAVRLHPHWLVEIVVLHTEGQPPVAIYRGTGRARLKD